MNRCNQNRMAFSLLELLAVITILGILAALILPRVTNGGVVAKEKTCFHNRAQINASVERYYVEGSVWPANDLSDIGANASFFPEGIPACPVSGQAYKLNASTHRVIGHTGGGKGGDHSPP